MKKTARIVGGIAICASISMVLSGCGGPSAGGAPTALTSIPDTDPHSHHPGRQPHDAR